MPMRIAAAPGELTSIRAAIPPSASACHGSVAMESGRSPSGIARANPIASTRRLARSAAGVELVAVPGRADNRRAFSAAVGAGNAIVIAGALVDVSNEGTGALLAAGLARCTAGGTATICASRSATSNTKGRHSIHRLLIAAPGQSFGG